MRIEIEHLPDIAILVVTKRLIGDEADDLVSTAQQILEEGIRKFVVDLGNVGEIDSSGLGSLIAAYTVVVKRGGRLVVVPPEAYFHPPMIMTSVLQVFEVYRSREEAIEALRNPDPAPEPAPVPDKAAAPQDLTGCLIVGGVFLLVSALALVVKLLRLLFHLIYGSTP